MDHIYLLVELAKFWQRGQTTFITYTEIISSSGYGRALLPKGGFSNAVFGLGPRLMGWYLWGLRGQNRIAQSKCTLLSPIKRIKGSEWGEQRASADTPPAKSLTLPFMTSKIRARNDEVHHSSSLETFSLSLSLCLSRSLSLSLSLSLSPTHKHTFICSAGCRWLQC